MISISRFRLPLKLAILLAFLLLSLLTGMLPVWLDALFKGSSADGFSAPSEFAPGWLKGILPALSPIAVFISYISVRGMGIAGAALLAGLALALAAWRGRFFCAWICPMGTVAEVEARLLPKGLLKKFPRINGVLFWIALSGALLGFSALLALDPLSSFSRIALLTHYPFPLAALIPAGVILLVLLLGLLRPMLWCSNVCPLGYALGLTQRLRVLAAKFAFKKEKPSTETVSEMRRDVLRGVCIGIPLAVISETAMGACFNAKGAKPPVLPPGALPLEKFHEACTRCYACVAACPSKVLSVEMPKDANLPAWFAPQLHASKSACWEDCNRCSQVCSPGAIRLVSKEEKRMLQIGVAKIDHSKCVAWAKGQQCMACDEYCPYKAIDSDMAQDGTPRPVIIESKCRGCGFCEMSCPVASPGPAIVIEGVQTQRKLDA